MYKTIIKPLLFRLDPEKAHHLTTSLFGFLLKVPLVSLVIKNTFRYNPPNLHKEVMGLKFPNPVGLAAGFDKDGKYYKDMSHLGFGFIEIGTVTPLPQDGNPQQRLFRLPKDKSLINRMGFNNEGVDMMVKRLKAFQGKPLIIGGNIGKNKLTPNDKAIHDYEISFNKLYDHVDYFVINVSSPNTTGLRELQDKEPLTRLIRHILQLRDQREIIKPVLLKIAPDLTPGQLDDILDIIKSEKLDGIIATNTTIDRNGLKTSQDEIERIGAGGLSGSALTIKSRNVVQYIREHNKEIVIIGVGGIDSPANALAMLNAGADLIQVYSSLVYEGPSFVKNIKKHLAKNI